MLTKLSSRSSVFLLLFAVAVLIAALVAVNSTSSAPDSRQIAYRYAEQMRIGNGLVFNPDERALLTSDPAYLFVLGLIAAIFPWLTVQAESAILFALCVGLGSAILYGIARKGGIGEGGSVLIAALYCAAWPFWAGIGTPAPLMGVLALASLDLALSDHWVWTGFALTLAILCDPAAALLGIPLALLAIRQAKALRFATALFVPLALAILILRIYYGPALWDELLLFKDLNSAPIAFSARLLGLLSLLLIGLAAWDGIQERDSNVASVCTGWMVLHLLVIGIVLRSGTPWAYSPLVGPVLILAALGWRRLTSNETPGTTRFVIVFRDRVYHVTNWFLKPLFLSSLTKLLLLAAFCGGSLMIVLAGRVVNAPQATLPEQIHSVGVSSTLQLPAVNSVQPMSIIAFDGQLQPDAKAMLERADWQSLLVHYAPDALILNGTGHVDAKLLNSGDAARLDYRPGNVNSQPGLYLRRAVTGTFQDHPADVSYGPDIRLVGLALDHSVVLPGDVVRVRLDWRLTRDADKPVSVDLGLVSDEWVLAHSKDTYDPGVFRVGPYSTYHTLKVLDSAWAGPVTLEVSVIVNNGIISRAVVATMVVKG